MNNNPLSTLSLASLLLLSGCQLTNETISKNNSISVERSYLNQKNALLIEEESLNTNNQVADNDSFQQIPSLISAQDNPSKNVVNKFNLDDKIKNITLASDGLKLNQFIHYTFNELLKLDYVLDDSAEKDGYTVTLNIEDPLTQKELYKVVSEILELRKFTIIQKEKLLYIIPVDSNSSSNDYAYGVGAQEVDVPNNQTVFQIVPLLYSQASELSLVLRSITKAQISLSQTGNLLYLQGSKDDISKTLEFIRLIDKPTQLAQNIGLIELTYNSAEGFSEQLQKIMTQEGITIGVNNNSSNSAVLIPIPSKGTVIVFAKTAEILQRIRYWTQLLDKADNTGESSYFIFRPDYARATDLGESLSNMLDVSGLNSSDLNESKTDFKASKNTTKRTNQNQGSSELKVSIDQRSNTLIISGTSSEYQKILPLLQSLDVLPKQIMLEVTIAEVTLKDDFKRGVEWAFNNGNYSMATKGALGLDKVGGFSYSLTGVNGKIQASLSQDNNLVNILSRPSIVVRDGVSASITVGTDIPIVGSTTTDPINGQRETTAIEYRKTGIELEVTPTVNSQGVVIMEIHQKISNTVEGGVSTGGSPSVFERTIKTEVVAGSGQTVILGGLISNNHTTGQSKVPFFGDIPILGGLFRVETDNKDKTELVVLVTPKIIDRQDEWQGIKIKFFNALDNLKFEGDTSSAN